MAYTKEQIEKAKTAASVDELIALAKAEEMELSEEKAKAIFAELHAEEAELSDAELDNVAGGDGCGGTATPTNCPHCGSPDFTEVSFPGGNASTAVKTYFCNSCGLGFNG